MMLLLLDSSELYCPMPHSLTCNSSHASCGTVEKGGVAAWAKVRPIAGVHVREWRLGISGGHRSSRAFSGCAEWKLFLILHGRFR